MKHVLVVTAATAAAAAVYRFLQLAAHPPIATAFSSLSFTTTDDARLRLCRGHHPWKISSSLCRHNTVGTTTWHPLEMAGSSDEYDDEEEDDDEEYSRYTSYNPIDDETPEERESRMELVRQLQKTFYKDEEGPELQGSTTSATTIIQNLPLWRVQWSELPGSQNVLNVHVPHYTNMFQKILKGQSKKWGEHDASNNNDDDDNNNNNYYFGHIFLPGGSENLDNPEYALKEGQVGTLMRVSDSRQQPDGRLTLVVQALETFEITKNVERSHSPYAIADVSIRCDTEQLLLLDDDEASSRAMAVSKAFAHHPFEYRRVSIDECEITSDDGTVVGLGVSPLSNYDGTKRIQIQQQQQQQPNEFAAVAAAASHHRDLVAVEESNVWIKMDELLKLLRLANNGVGIPVPTQLMGLLPCSRSVLDGTTTTKVVSIRTEAWPDDFALERTVTNMEERETSTVGTHSKSPFVRVDDDDENENDDCRYNYSPLRRAQRLSYVVWALTGSIALPGFDGTNDLYSRERILGLTSTQERLELANEKMNKVCLLLKKILKLQD